MFAEQLGARNRLRAESNSQAIQQIVQLPRVARVGGEQFILPAVERVDLAGPQRQRISRSGKMQLVEQNLQQ